MLVLTFRVAGVPFAIAVGRVVEVVPRVPLRAVPHAPAHLAGLLRYRGGVVPVVDLGLLMGGPACGDRLDTRIVLADAGREGGLGRVAHQGAHVGAPSNELVDDRATDGAGGACDEDGACGAVGHGDSPGCRGDGPGVA